MEHAVICLEEQQDEFDFKCQTHRLEGEHTEDVLMSADREEQNALSHICMLSLCFDLFSMETLLSSHSRRGSETGADENSPDSCQQTQRV